MASLHDCSVRAVASVVVGMIIIFMWVIFRDFKTKKSILPPGPRPLPIVGNLFQLGELPHHSLTNLAKKYGPIMYLRLGSFPTVVVSSPAMAKEFLKTHDLVFANRPKSSSAKYMGYNGGDIFFSNYGEHWRQMRKLCTLELFTAKRMESYRGLREEEVAAMIGSIAMKSRVDLRQRLTVLKQNIICRIMAGRRFSEDEMCGGQSFTEMVRERFALGGSFCIGDFIPFLDWFDFGGFHRRMKRIHAVFDDFAVKVIDDHILRRRSVNVDGHERVKDLVDVLLDMAEFDPSITTLYIKSIMLDMITAAMETSSTTIEWAVSELLRNPSILTRAQEEIEGVAGKRRLLNESDVASLVYLRCIVKETFRLHPAGPLLAPHESSEACNVGGYNIPKGTRLIVNVWAIGRDETVWKDAQTFKPERFIGKNIDVRGQHYELLPFGSGRRACPAISMGFSMVEFVLAQLLHCFDWSEQSELNMDEAFGLTTPRKFPLFAHAKWKLSISP
ncbi:cytochrome P450 750A1-like [Cryptomeria japonica]|uniref:cytochrome P450 750A1-like n=1 Tax=Cryptomeria japonica TaxID=3369 RepID=UPI0027D9FE41|nr:cytochrome P450 750A1-like [Cryptomeria japonica]